MIQDYELTLLTEGQVWGNDSERQLDVLKKYGTKSAITDLVVLTGGYIDDSCSFMAPDDDTLTGRTGWTWTQSSYGDGDVRDVYEDGCRFWDYSCLRSGAVRPALLSSSLIHNISPNRVRGYNGTFEVEFGEYPQNAADSRMQDELERAYNRGAVRTTGKDYTFDSRKYDDYDYSISPVSYNELEYQGEKYIRIKANSAFVGRSFKLSNGIECVDGNFFWVKVEPVKWLIDENTGTLVSKKGLVSGIRFNTKDRRYDGDFSRTEMKSYLDTYMSKDMFKNVTITKASDMTPQEKAEYEVEKKDLKKEEILMD